MYWAYTVIDLEQIIGFDWDEGNSRRSADKHDVSQAEAETIFFNDPLIVVGDQRHSDKEHGSTLWERPARTVFCMSPSRSGGTEQ